jgi:hypothetical protein
MNQRIYLTLDYQMPYEKQVSGLLSKFGLQIRNNYFT